MRIFAFGCSYTALGWPTWADIIGISSGHVYENWGNAGSGNAMIANRIMHCDLVNNIQASDIVLIEWTFTGREDRIYDGMWKPQGGVHHSDFYGKDFAKYWDDGDGLNKTIASMYYVNQLLKSKRCPVYQTSILGKGYYQEQLDLYNLGNGKDNLQKAFDACASGFITGIDEYFCAKLSQEYPIKRIDRPGWLDFHPLPLEHLEWVETFLPMMVTDKAREIAHKYQDVILNATNLHDGSQVWFDDPLGLRIHGKLTK